MQPNFICTSGYYLAKPLVYLAKLSLNSRGLFLKSPENFSGPKSQLSNLNLLGLKS